MDYYHPDASQAISTRFKHIQGLILTLELISEPTPLATVHSIELRGLSTLDEAQDIDWPTLETAVIALAPTVPMRLRRGRHSDPPSRAQLRGTACIEC